MSTQAEPCNHTLKVQLSKYEYLPRTTLAIPNLTNPAYPASGYFYFGPLWTKHRMICIPGTWANVMARSWRRGRKATLQPREKPLIWTQIQGSLARGAHNKTSNKLACGCLEQAQQHGERLMFSWGCPRYLCTASTLEAMS